MIEFLRGLAILGVISVHVSTNYYKIPDSEFNYPLMFTNAFLQSFLRYGVPMFLVISGFVLGAKYDEKFSAKEFYLKRLSRIVVPYIVFSSLYMCIFGSVHGWPSFQEFFYKLLTAKAATHLWFFKLIIMLYLLYPFIMRVYCYLEKLGKVKQFLIGVLCLQLVSGIMVAGPTSFFKLGQLTVLQFCFYFILGIFVGRNQHAVLLWLQVFGSKQRWRLLGVLLIVSFILAKITYGHFIAHGKDYFLEVANTVSYPLLHFVISSIWLVFGVQLYQYFLSRKSSVINLLTELGKYSFGIYLIHLIFMGLIVRMLKVVHITRTEYVFYPLLFVGTMVFSYWSVWLIHRTFLSEYVLSMRRSSFKEGGKLEGHNT